MNSRLWRLYCAVYECQSVSGAAEQLVLSQPAVSMHLRTIERTLDARLFYRSGRRMLPTEAGVAVYRHAKEVLKGESELVAIVRELNEGRAGVIDLGATHMVGSYFVPPMLSQFNLSHPEAEIAVHIHPKEQLFAGLLAGDLDFAVMTASGMPAGLVSTEFHRERLVVVASPQHPLAASAPARLADLQRYPLIAFSRGTGLNDTILARLSPGDGAESVRVAMYLGHAEAMNRVAEAGVGYAVLFESAVQRELDLGLLKDVTPADMDVSYPPFAVVYRVKKQFSALQQRFLHHLLGSDITE